MVVVVLGSRLQSDGLHPELVGRMETGLEAMERTAADYLLLTGGRTNPDVPRAECEAMAEYAVERGVDPGRVWLEDRSLDTVGNAYGARLILDRLDAGAEVCLVSSAYHLPRAAYVFDQCLGEDYVLDTRFGFKAADGTPGEAERRRLDVNRELLGEVAPGDLAAIRRRIQASHDLYDDLEEFHRAAASPRRASALV